MPRSSGRLLVSVTVTVVPSFTIRVGPGSCIGEQKPTPANATGRWVAVDGATQRQPARTPAQSSYRIFPGRTAGVSTHAGAGRHCQAASHDHQEMCASRSRDARKDRGLTPEALPVHAARRETSLCERKSRRLGTRHGVCSCLPWSHHRSDSAASDSSTSFDPRPLRRWQLMQAASAPLSVAPDSRVACTGCAQGSRPCRYRVSPTEGVAGAAPSAYAQSSGENPAAAERAEARRSVGTGAGGES
jgi:hypothetical protein